MATASLSRSDVRRFPRIDGRLATGLVLLAVSVLGGLRFVAAVDRSVPVVTVTRDLATGHVLVRGDLSVTRVRAAGPVLDGLVAGEDLDHLAGRVLLAPVARHGLLATAALARARGEGREITVPVDAAHALGGDIRVGEHVDVLASYGKGTDGARTVTVVQGGEVVGVRRASGVFAQGSRDLNAITLLVPADSAVALAFAIRNAELDVVRSAGADPGGRDRYDFSDLEPAP